MTASLRELVFARTIFRAKIFLTFFFSFSRELTNIHKETYFKHFVGIKFSKCRQKDIYYLPYFLKSDVYMVKERLDFRDSKILSKISRFMFLCKLNFANFVNC